MWPHKKGLGVRLSYGVSGNATISLDSTKDTTETTSDDSSLIEPSYQFARQHDPSKQLRPIEEESSEQDATQLIPPSTSNFTNNSNIYNRLQSPRIPNKPSQRKGNDELSGYIPSDLVSSFLIESKTLTSNIAYDPNYGDLFVLFDLLVKKRTYITVDAMAFVSGESMTILNLCIYDKRNLNKLSKRRQVNFSDPIRQIEIITGSQTEATTATLILIRTTARVYVLTCTKSAETMDLDASLDIELRIIGEVKTNELEGNQFADVKFNPISIRQFAVVDMNGNFAIWNITKTLSGIKKLNLNNQINPVSDVSEISSWKKIFWIHNSNHLLVLTRSKISQYTITAETLAKQILVTSNTWSRIRDFKIIHQQSSSSAFLLTSKELIWFDLSQGNFTRQLSWKHFLDDRDPSLKFNITVVRDETIIIMIYSQINPMIMIYTFGFMDGKPCSLLDPYYMTKGFNHSDLRQVSLVEAEQGNFNLFELSTSLAVHVRRLTMGSVGSFVEPSSMEIDDISDETVMENQTNTKGLSKKRIHNLVKELTKNFSNEEPSESQMMEDVLRYANGLDQALSTLNENPEKAKDGYISLYEFCEKEPPLSVHDLLELDDMIAQFEETLPKDDIKMVSLINNSFIKRSPFIIDNSDNTAKTHITDIAEHVQKIYYQDDRFKKYNNVYSKIAMSTLLGTSLIKCQLQNSSNNFKNQYDESIKKSPKFVQSILEEWDTPEISASQEESQDVLYDTYSTMPTLGASQKQTSILSQPQPSGFNSSQSIFPESQNSQMSTNYSQSQTPFSQSQMYSQSRPISASQRKKKRKKKGGFS
ncbi:uncharacterized protein J8A68_001400 [[Candida] subhashii]|uniref:RRN6 beta-propeller domain-containing protein n=1 Tax=[Candida] subhashii TaxID=561895 RepID=A0A8J5QI78_9ASCO|nr:uncharacterized protein J8A68_001400 [[Candida] subhashii]KAG7665091.1 hypothetical protein J8A68_001400 [[Candida] subhashii]